MQHTARLAFAVLLCAMAVPVMADTAITYQGQLKNAGTPHTGTPDMTFRLYDSPTGGQQVGPTLSRSAVPVEDGLFRVELDFGVGFSGPRWLEIDVQGTTLTPRQKLTGTTRAVRALTVDGLAVGEACNANELCESGVCLGGTCAPPSCNDGIQNGQETGMDCGGGGCTPCPAGQGCGFAGDCLSQVCLGGTCQVPSCSDDVLNGSETDTDCGGPDCGPCEAGDSCGDFPDCASGICSGGTCQMPTCSDGIQNGEETDVDCGGSSCGGCGAGESCHLNSDCVSGNCDSHICQ